MILIWGGLGKKKSESQVVPPGTRIFFSESSSNYIFSRSFKNLPSEFYFWASWLKKGPKGELFFIHFILLSYWFITSLSAQMPVCVVLSLIKEKENESAWYDAKAKERGLSLFPSSASLITFLVSDEPEKNANKGEGKGEPRDRGKREIEI